jgi:hypothetical protein
VKNAIIHIKFNFKESWEDLLSTQIKLEFYQRRKRQWPLPDETAPWESQFKFVKNFLINFIKVWELRLNLVRTQNNGNN